jgi:uncharacterized repeat protein (TIGR03803 family)
MKQLASYLFLIIFIAFTRNVQSQTNKLLWGTTSGGGTNGGGTIYNFDRITNSIKKVFDFEGTTTYSDPEKLVSDDEGNLYGIYSSLGEIYTLSSKNHTLKVIRDYVPYKPSPYKAIFSSNKKLTGILSYYKDNGGGFFSCNTDGSNYKEIKLFSKSQPYIPQSIIEGRDGYCYGILLYEKLQKEFAIYRIKLDGSDFSILKKFNTSIEGYEVYDDLFIGTDNNIYMKTNIEGKYSNGTFLKISLDGSKTTIIDEIKEYSQIEGIVEYNKKLYFSYYKNNTYSIGQLELGNTNIITRIKNLISKPNSLILAVNRLIYTINSEREDNKSILKSYNLDINEEKILVEIQTDNKINLNKYNNQLKLFGTINEDKDASNAKIFEFDLINNNLKTLFQGNVNDTGTKPSVDMVADNNGNFYGATANGGSYSAGTIFKINKNGTYQVLVHLKGSDIAPNIIKKNIFDPIRNQLVVRSNKGGKNNLGGIFSISLDGKNIDSIFDYDNSWNGENNALEIIIVGNKLYFVTNAYLPNEYRDTELFEYDFLTKTSKKLAFTKDRNHSLFFSSVKNGIYLSNFNGWLYFYDITSNTIKNFTKYNDVSYIDIFEDLKGNIFAYYSLDFGRRIFEFNKTDGQITQLGKTEYGFINKANIVNDVIVITSNQQNEYSNGSKGSIIIMQKDGKILNTINPFTNDITTGSYPNTALILEGESPTLAVQKDGQNISSFSFEKAGITLESKTQELSIINESDNTLEIKEITLENTSNGMKLDISKLKNTLLSKDKTAFTVTFSPIELKNYTNTILITTNLNISKITLTGEGSKNKQTINFEPFGAAYVSDGTITTKATVNSKNTIVFSSSDSTIAKVNIDKVILRKAGNVIIKANASETSIYEKALEASQNLFILQPLANEDNFTEMQVLVYPNPTADNLFIKFPENLNGKKKSILLSDGAGKLIMNQETNSSDYQLILPKSNSKYLILTFKILNAEYSTKILIK